MVDLISNLILKLPQTAFTVCCCVLLILTAVVSIRMDMMEVMERGNKLLKKIMTTKMHPCKMCVVEVKVLLRIAGLRN